MSVSAADPNDVGCCDVTTGEVTHSLDTHIRTKHALAGIRPHLFLTSAAATAPASAASAVPFAAPGAPGTSRPGAAPETRPVAEPDGATRNGAFAPLDSQGRAHLGKVLATLGWGNLTDLVA